MKIIPLLEHEWSKKDMLEIQAQVINDLYDDRWDVEIDNSVLAAKYDFDVKFDFKTRLVTSSGMKGLKWYAPYEVDVSSEPAYYVMVFMGLTDAYLDLKEIPKRKFELDLDSGEPILVMYTGSNSANFVDRFDISFEPGQWKASVTGDLTDATSEFDTLVELVTWVKAHL